METTTNTVLKTYHQKHRTGSVRWCLKACKMHQLRSLMIKLGSSKRETCVELKKIQGLGNETQI